MQGVMLFFSVFLLFINNAKGICESQIFCKGPLLDALQRAQLVSDSKTLVDMPIKFEPTIVLQNFLQLENRTQASLKEFLDTYYAPAGVDVIDIIPEDWNPSPAFLSKIKDPQLQEFGTWVNSIWKNLTKKFDHSQYCSECYSSIEVDYPFVVAGDRFREFYYWDSFWIIEGLLVSGMHNTTRGMILNMISLIQKIGFIPNGGRIYYLNRSQPPMITQIVYRYWEETLDMDLLQTALPYLDMEYQFWLFNRSISVDINGVTYKLQRYDVDNSLPRPEGYMADVNATKNMTPLESANYYGQVSTAAESGEDFSSEWFTESFNFSTIHTKKVVPVGLNSILLKNELTLAELHSLLGNEEMSQYYINQAYDRMDAIFVVFWNQEKNQWLDFDMWMNSSNENFYATNWMPLWALGEDTPGYDSDKIIDNILLNEEGFEFPGGKKKDSREISGIPTSLFNNSQQWDFPNVWAPLNYFLIEGILNVNSTDAFGLAFNLAQRWITTTFCGYKKHGLMFEKYDATRIGESGGGGEYRAQSGFGWTNGLTLYLLEMFGESLVADISLCNL